MKTTNDSTGEEGGGKDCPKCGGSGFDDEDEEHKGLCPVCKGTGEEEGR